MNRDAIRARVNEKDYTVSQFVSDTYGYLKDTYGLNTDQAGVIYRHAWNEGHSGGKSGVFIIVEDVITMLEQLGFIKEVK